MIIIIDFGSQSTHLISRRIRELGASVLIVEPEEALGKIKELNPQGIILSGGPASVYEKNSPKIEKEIFDMGIPILGICYGEQLMSYLLEGKVRAGKIKEYGPATVELKQSPSALFAGTAPTFTGWMSHGDEVISPPRGYASLATTSTIPHAAIGNAKKNIYGIQFHPEVVHTQFGTQILSNFLNISGTPPQKREIDSVFVESLIDDIRDSLGKEKAICALSGGVDSSVAALLVYKAIGGNLTCFFIDSGLMREGETEDLREAFKENYDMKIVVIDAKDEFLKSLEGVTDPEEKRKAIGKTFIDVFEREAEKINSKFLVQGTIYPDVIESKGSKHSQNIKSHHNVGGLPEDMKFTLVEPLRDFYKDEVRKIGSILGLPDAITKRQPFPGPGLAVRIIGEVTEEKLKILRKADKIIRDEIEIAGLTHALWQVFAVFTGIKTTGVRGDARVYGETIGIRALEAVDAMSAEFAKLPWELLQKISSRIVTEIPEVNRVVYDITTKPPATMEWE